MTVFDYVFLGLLAFSALIGMWRGLVSEVMAVLAWAAALTSWPGGVKLALLTREISMTDSEGWQIFIYRLLRRELQAFMPV